VVAFPYSRLAGPGEIGSSGASLRQKRCLGRMSAQSSTAEMLRPIEATALKVSAYSYASLSESMLPIEMMANRVPRRSVRAL